MDSVALEEREDSVVREASEDLASREDSEDSRAVDVSELFSRHRLFPCHKMTFLSQSVM